MPDSVPVIRQATPEDDKACGEIAVLAWERVFAAWREGMGPLIYRQFCEGWEDRKRADVVGFVREHPDWTFVTECEGQVVGFLTWFLPGQEGVGEIGNNAVHPAWQGHGVGGAQVRAALEQFRALELTSATVYTGLDEGHAPARAMYEKAGFNVAMPHVRYYLEL
jgi:ribosomal protein S18 acetylase RimI-like enzyme